MDTECYDFPILNDNLENVFEKEDTDSFNDSIFLPTQFEEIQLLDDSSQTPPGHRRSDKRPPRQARKDDFDYNAYIKEEMKKHDGDALPENLRKHMIQKIRNRMSAQRSRLRQKNMQESMEKENEILKEQNAELKLEILQLRAENERLRKKLHLAETSEGTSVDEKTGSEKSVYTRDKTVTGTFPVSKVSVFLALAVVCAFLVPGSAPMDNPAVKMGGIIPMLTSSLPQTSRHLKTVETICSDFCKSQRVLCDRDLDRGATLQYLQRLNKLSAMEPQEGTEKQIELFDKVNAQKLICFDPESPVETENIFRIIVGAQAQGHLTSDDVYLGQFEKLVVE
jgi:hypothetical protein